MQKLDYFSSGYGEHLNPYQRENLDDYILNFSFMSSFGDFKGNWRNWCESLKSSSLKILLLDDGTLFSDFVRALFEESSVNFERLAISEVQHISWNHLSDLLPLVQPRDLLDVIAADVSLKTKQLVICPRFQVRIWNMNYNRVEEKEYGSPYFVYIESEKGHLLRTWSMERNLSIQWNLAFESQGLFASYFQLESLRSWIESESCPEPHNDHLDRLIFSKFISCSDLYKRSQFKPELIEEFHSLLKPRTYQNAFFPIHGFYQKYFGLNVNCNQMESFLYGPAL